MKETLLLTKHMREFPEDSHQIEIYEKNNGYSALKKVLNCLLYTSPSPRDKRQSRMPSSA